jgi:hypothetical protein
MIDVRSVIPSPRPVAQADVTSPHGLRGEPCPGLHRGAIEDHGAGAPPCEVSPRLTGSGKLIGALILPGRRGGCGCIGHGPTHRRGSARRAGTVPPMVVITDLIAPIRADRAAVQNDAG